MRDPHEAQLPRTEPEPQAAAVSEAQGTVAYEGEHYGCQECLVLMKRDPKTYWVHLRKCLTCGHVGCCDSSPHKHARHHAKHDHGAHPIIRSFEPGEDWRFCFLDERAF